MLIALLLSSVADAQVFVSPRRPGQTVVRYFPHDWRIVDLMEGEKLQGMTSGGFRLYFYEEERLAAERASIWIEEAYRDLSETFAFAPPERFSYVLYGTYTEFLRTNLFPVGEGTLGVTSPRTLEVTLPYFGDHRKFKHVSKHELVHQFTIQKVEYLGRTQYGRNPIFRLPLWFIEGIAEYYAHGGIDPETEMVVTDLVANQNFLKYHALPDFWADHRGSWAWTYKLGQARATFLEETYGDGTIQRILDSTPLMVATDGRMGFEEIVAKVTGESPEAVATRFEHWVKKRVFETWLETDQDRHDVVALENVKGFPLSLDADGDLIVYRSVSYEEGRTLLYATDRRQPQRHKRLIGDGGPRAENLHAADDRNFDVKGKSVVYVAERRGADVICVQTMKRTVKSREEKPYVAGNPDRIDGMYWKVKLRRGKCEVHRLGPQGVVAAHTPALSPDSTQVAFVGVGRDGTRDLYVLTRKTGTIERITEDERSERYVLWTKDGIVYGSDDTEHGFTNLFQWTNGERTRLTHEARDHLAPTELPDGRLLFTSWDDGVSNLQEYVADADPGEPVVPGHRSLTDLATGTFDPAPGPDGGVWTMTLYEGSRRPTLVPDDTLHEGELVPTPPDPGPAPELPRRDLADRDYRPLDLSNWSPTGLFALIGGGPGGIWGQVYFAAADELKDRGTVLQANVYGTPELTDGYLLYVDQSRRQTYGAGPFQGLRFRFDQTFEDELDTFQSAERFFGVLGTVRHPFGRFAYVQLDESFGGADYFLLDDIPSGRVDLWEEANATRLQSETTARIGVDTVRYHYKTGPLSGSSAMVEGSYGVHPVNNEHFARARTDAQHYIGIPITEGANLGFKGSLAGSFGGRFARQYWLWSSDTIRAIPLGSTDLLGRYYFFTGSELQVPLDALFNVALASTVEGIVGVDFGAVSNTTDALWDDRVLDLAVGGNIVVGPLVLRIHFAKAFDTGNGVPSINWVPNVSLNWLGQ